MKYALVDVRTGEVVNTIQFDGDYTPASGLNLVATTLPVQPGDIWDGKLFKARSEATVSIEQMSDLQFRAVLSRMQLREAVEQAIENAGDEMQDFWDRSLTISRHHWFIEELKARKAIDHAAVEAIFTTGSDI